MIVLALGADVVLTFVFALVGRSSHAEALDPAGVWGTWWPFLLALGIGWLITLAWRHPLAPVRTGIPIWGVTLVGGMLLRAVSGQGTAVPFIIVAAVALALTLIGWRVVARLIQKVRVRGAREPKE